MSIDIVIYAVIAALILARLWSVFGRRNENDAPPPNPFAPPAPKGDAAFKDAPQALPSPLVPHAPPHSLQGELEQIKAIDPAFDEKQFLQGARTAFAQIVGDFARGEMGASERLLGPKVLARFQAAIDARRKAGQTMQSRIARVKDAETVSAGLDGDEAHIVVRFVSEQENVLRDASGKVVGGAEGKLEEITDLWSFARDLKGTNPDWTLIETKS